MTEQDTSGPDAEQEKYILDFLEKTVDHFTVHSTICINETDDVRVAMSAIMSFYTTTLSSLLTAIKDQGRPDMDLVWRLAAYDAFSSVLSSFSEHQQITTDS